jgi:hypothetical protein
LKLWPNHVNSSLSTRLVALLGRTWSRGARFSLVLLAATLPGSSPPCWEIREKLNTLSLCQGLGQAHGCAGPAHLLLLKAHARTRSGTILGAGRQHRCHPLESWSSECKMRCTGRLCCRYSSHNAAWPVNPFRQDCSRPVAHNPIRSTAAYIEAVCLLLYHLQRCSVSV